MRGTEQGTPIGSFSLESGEHSLERGSPGVQMSPFFWRYAEDDLGWGPLAEAGIPTAVTLGPVCHLGPRQVSTRPGARPRLKVRAGDPGPREAPGSSRTPVLLRPQAFLLPGCPPASLAVVTTTVTRSTAMKHWPL